MYMYLSIFVGIVAGAITYSLTGPNRLSASTAKAMIQSGAIKTVVDVRTKTEYDAGHYPGAIHIPVTKMNALTTRNLPRSGGILVYCNTGQRARFASEKLQKLGFKNVYYITGTYSSIITTK